MLLRRPFGETMRRIALTNAFVDLPTFFDTQVLAIERQWPLPTKSTTLFVPLERISSVIAYNRAALRSRIVERGRSSPVTRRLPPNSLAGVSLWSRPHAEADDGVDLRSGAGRAGWL